VSGGEGSGVDASDGEGEAVVDSVAPGVALGWAVALGLIEISNPVAKTPMTAIALTATDTFLWPAQTPLLVVETHASMTEMRSFTDSASVCRTGTKHTGDQATGCFLRCRESRRGALRFFLVKPATFVGEVASTRLVARPSSNQADAAVVNRIMAEEVVAETRDPTRAVVVPMTSQLRADRRAPRKSATITPRHQAKKVAAPRGPVETRTDR
jgi:hypothetical protein